MKRPYSHMSTSLLPILGQNDPRKFKSILDGTYNLKVLKAVDISKPAAKPVDEIDEPENEDEATEIRLNQNNARMIQLNLIDSNNTQINALETERIEMLNSLKPNWKIYIEGPVEMRCGNIMLEKKHVTNVEPPSPDDERTLPEQQAVIAIEQRAPPPAPPASVIDVDDDSGPAIIVEHIPTPRQPRSTILNQERTHVKESPEIQVVEDWDEEYEEDEDDCIIID